MRKFLFLFLFLSILSEVLNQNTTSVFDAKEIVFFGLDFSKAKMISPNDFNDAYEIKNKYFDAWNGVIFKERSKYNISKIFKFNNVIYDFKVTQDVNQKIDVSKIIAENASKLSDEDIQKSINEYKIEKDKNGIGLSVIVESFDKPKLIGIMYITFFDIGTRKILFTAEMKGKPGGFGLRNYWIRTFHNVLEKIDRIYYVKWKKKI